MSKQNLIDAMFNDAEYAALFEMQRASMIELVVYTTLKHAAKRFYDQSIIMKGSIDYAEVADELTEMSKEV